MTKHTFSTAESPSDEDDLPDQDSKEQLRMTMVTYGETLEGTHRIINDDMTAAEHLLEIESLVEAIQNAETIAPVKIVPRNGRCAVGHWDSPLAEAILSAVFRSDALLKQHFPYHAFSPQVDLFLRHKERLVKRLLRIGKGQTKSDALNLGVEPSIRGEDDTPSPLLPGELPMLRYLMVTKYPEATCEAINTFVGGIKRESNGNAYKTKLRRSHHAVAKNRASLQRYVDRLFEQYARLLVIRLDLSYVQSVSPSGGEETIITFDQACEHRRRFLRGMRYNHLFDHLVGYVWKLEYGPAKGFHFHCLFFFNGALRRQDEWLAEQIGEHWKRLVGGVGMYWNCNARKNDYDHLGIGMMDHWDETMRRNLDAPIDYLTKPDFHLKLVAPNSERTFGKGIVQDRAAGLGGRPRRRVE